MAITDTDITFLLFERIAAEATITSLVGTRIRPDTIDPNETMPAIRYEMVSSSSWPYLQGSGKEARSRVQFDCYGATRAQANQVAEAVRMNLDGFSGALGTTEVYDCVMDNRYDRVDPPAQGSKHWRKRRTLDFVVTHTEPTPTL